MQVALAAATQWLLYGIVPSTTGFLGMILVLSSGLYLAVRTGGDSRIALYANVVDPRGATREYLPAAD